MAESDRAGVPRGRNREATRDAILLAARDLLAAEGFQGFGVNAIARRAGCDKQLVYRYFGGLEGLVDAIGADLAGWVEDRLAPIAALGRPASYAELMENLALGFLHALRTDPLVQKILAWELSDASPHVRRLTEARSRALAAWLARERGPLQPPAGLDAAAMNAILIAAIQQMVLSAAATGQCAGMPLAAEADWERPRQMLRRIIRALAG